MPASRGRCSSGTSFDERSSCRFVRSACDPLFSVVATEWRRDCARVGETMSVVMRISLPGNLPLLGILSMVVCGCGQSTEGRTSSGAATSSGGGAGGAVSSSKGGTSSASGTVSAGGAVGSGGTVATGGSKATGGALGTGGATEIGTGGNSTGGAIAAGGNTGGMRATGGSTIVNTGGAVSAGGANPTGGTRTGSTTAVGGSAASSGAAGRAALTGGANATAGVPSTGGSRPTGGATGLGGATGTGGNANVAGTSNSMGCGNTTLPAACNTSTTGPCTINVDGTDRQYFVVLPSNYSPTTPYPIVFLWHGASTTAQMYIGGGPIAYYGIRTGLPNAIFVAAQGLPSTAGGTDYGWANTNGQDVNFTKAMIDWLESKYCIDKNRLYSTGFSYGGIMSLTLACQMADVFRAIGVMSGAMFGGTSSCQKNPVPAWFTHGDADPTLNISGGVTARDALIKRNGCDTTNTQTAAMSDGITTCTIYNVCTAGNYPVVWCPVPGETHQIPGFAGAEIAKFFLQF
jgi:polyhydroxybutyrate depolymerase